jgi:hypothetical protein
MSQKMCWAHARPSPLFFSLRRSSTSFFSLSLERERERESSLFDWYRTTVPRIISQVRPAHTHTQIEEVGKTERGRDGKKGPFSFSFKNFNDRLSSSSVRFSLAIMWPGTVFTIYIYDILFSSKENQVSPFFFFDSLVSYFFLSIQIFYYAWKGLVGWLVVAFVLLSKCQPPPTKCTAVRWPCRLVVVTTGVVVVVPTL